MKSHPLKICMFDDCDELFSKGHHDPDAFLRACEEFIEKTKECPIDRISRVVVHDYRRNVPARWYSDYSYLMISGEAGVRGSFTCTSAMLDLYQNRAPGSFN